jgi:DNA polymerase-3 subunit delta'
MIYQWNVIGHEKELAMIEGDFLANAVHHAYLFVGPEKVGKFRVAKSIAGILQCPNDFCRTCPSCIQIEKKCHPDTIELEDDGESIKVDQIREILARLSMTCQSKYKVLLIENIARLTDEASNCLLKSLEEPTGKTVFIFTVERLREVMPTIISRMRMIHFKKLHDAVLMDALHKQYPDIDEVTLRQVILLSLGRSGRALQLLANPEMFEELRDVYSQIEFLNDKAGIASRFMSMEKLPADPKKMKTFLALLTHYLRQKMMDAKDVKEADAKIHLIEEIHRMIDMQNFNVNPRMLLENIMLSL